MKELLCNVNFRFTNEEVNKSPIATEVLKTLFLAMRDKAVKRINPMFDIWNIGWDEITDENRDAYNAYISNRQQKILDQVNEDYPGKMKLMSDDDCDIYAIVYKDDGTEFTKVYMTITLLN